MRDSEIGVGSEVQHFARPLPDKHGEEEQDQWKLRKAPCAAGTRIGASHRTARTAERHEQAADDQNHEEDIGHNRAG